MDKNKLPVERVKRLITISSKQKAPWQLIGKVSRSLLTQIFTNYGNKYINF